MVEIIATAESVEQAKSLIQEGVDILYIGEGRFGLRLPAAFSYDEIKHITDYAHQKQKQVRIAVNAIMHNEHLQEIVPYLQFLQEAGVDAIVVGDPGVVHLMKKHDFAIPFVYDAQTLVTNATQINFWAKRNATAAVLARELTKPELAEIAEKSMVPLEILVYGATCIHQSKRPLVKNYFEFIEEDEDTGKDRGLFISEPKNKDTHYSIYEDQHGTHIFANNDINLLSELDELVNMGITQWKLDGIFVKGKAFVSIAKLFVQAKEAILQGNWTEVLQEELQTQLMNFHPEERGLDKGFYVKNPDDVQ